MGHRRSLHVAPLDRGGIAEQVEYAGQIARQYESALPRGLGFEGARVLELGPGPYLATALLLAARGALVTVADPYLPEWNDQVHRPLCQALADRLANDRTDLRTGCLDAVIWSRSFAPALRCLAAGAEAMDDLADASFDLVLSNAVLEHVEDVPRALFHLARVTAPGGVGVHQVDFRDHQDFSRPLEYLTLAADVFWHDSSRCHGERGNRWRHTHLLGALATAGFSIQRFDCGLRADAGYVSRLRGRLHRDFAALRPHVLSVLVGGVVCTRTDAAAAMPGVPLRGLRLPAARGLHTRTTSRRVLIYGAGAGGVEAVARLQSLGLASSLIGVCDSDARLHGRLVGGHVVQPLDALDPRTYDSVLVASERGRAAIEKMLLDRGLVEDPELRPLGFIGAFMRPLREAA